MQLPWRVDNQRAIVKMIAIVENNDALKETSNVVCWQRELAAGGSKTEIT